MPFFRRFESIIFMHIQQFIAAYWEPTGITGAYQKSIHKAVFRPP
jgi:membrane-bound acyltransferase YfiQ involved in biofilm formation